MKNHKAIKVRILSYNFTSLFYILFNECFCRWVHFAEKSSTVWTPWSSQTTSHLPWGQGQWRVPV